MPAGYAFTTKGDIIQDAIQNIGITTGVKGLISNGDITQDAASNTGITTGVKGLTSNGPAKALSYHGKIVTLTTSSLATNVASCTAVGSDAGGVITVVTSATVTAGNIATI